MPQEHTREEAIDQLVEEISYDGDFDPSSKGKLKEKLTELLDQAHSDWQRELHTSILQLGEEYQWTGDSVGAHVLKRVLELPFLEGVESPHRKNT